MLNWILAVLCAMAWFGSFGWYFRGDFGNWLRKRYWWQRTLRALRK